MEYISSDTNVWIDFFAIRKLALPFRLPYTYIMYEEAVENELIKPTDMGQMLISLGLESVDISLEELMLADQLNEKYRHPTKYDCVALAIAKVRGLVLLTGDGPLRKAAEQEGVQVIGTIGILDRLLDGEMITVIEYRDLQGERKISEHIQGGYEGPFPEDHQQAFRECRLLHQRIFAA